MENINQLSTTSQININPHTKDLFTLIPTTQFNIFAFSKEKKYAKKQKKKGHFEQKSPESDLDIREMLELLKKLT